MENSQSLCSPTSLLMCKEIVDDDEEEEMEAFASIGEEDGEYITTLLDREIANGGLLQVQGFQPKSWIQEARLDGIDYILKKTELLGFGFQTAYTSVAYLDRFLSRRSIAAEKSWAIRLLSMACLSLAAKMDESRVVALSELCVEDYSFESSVIQRMELLVLNTLEWKMGSITPFAFIQFFGQKFWDNSPIRDGLSRTAQVILASMRDVKIMCHKPSVIAAAATLVVLDHALTREALQFKLGTLTSTHSINIVRDFLEDIISCYYLVQEMHIERLKLSRGMKSPELSPIELHRLDPYGSSASAKRKRLVFNQDDQSDDLVSKKEKPDE